jgi:hypothetical protein
MSMALPMRNGVMTLSRNSFGSIQPPPPAFVSHCTQTAYWPDSSRAVRVAECGEREHARPDATQHGMVVREVIPVGQQVGLREVATRTEAELGR